MTVELIIPYEPFGKQRPRFGGGRTYTPTATRDYEKTVALTYLDGHFGKFGGAVRIDILAVHAVPKSYSKRKTAETMNRPWQGKPDCDNIAKAILDGLNGVAFEDDRQVTALTVVKQYGYKPFVKVKIQEDTE